MAAIPSTGSTPYAVGDDDQVVKVTLTGATTLASGVGELSDISFHLYNASGTPSSSYSALNTAMTTGSTANSLLAKLVALLAANFTAKSVIYRDINHPTIPRKRIHMVAGWWRGYSSFT